MALEVVMFDRLAKSSRDMYMLSVSPAKSVGGALDAIQLGSDAFQQFVKQAAFQRDEPFVRTQNLAFQLLQLRERHMLFLPLVEIRRENPVESPVLYYLH